MMNFKTILLATACLTAPALALAQNTPTKPPAKAAAPAPAATNKAETGKTTSISGKPNSGPILTRDELRACFSQEESIRTRLGALDGRRAPLDQEKASLATDQAALKVEREPVDAIKKAAEDLSARLKDYGARVQAWNDRVTAFNATPPSGAKAERERTEINKDRAELETQQKALEAEKTKLSSDSEVAVRNYNTKAQALEARVTDWNTRNEAWNKDSKGLQGERSEWVTSCSDRRYREDDEIAIRKGK
jgi:chromosome segregation ATPase